MQNSINIELVQLIERPYSSPIEWKEQNNYLNGALLTGTEEMSQFSLAGWNIAESISISDDKSSWETIASLIDKYSFTKLPFPANRCGWIGYLSYELGRTLEVLPDDTIQNYSIPNAIFTLYKNYRYWDNIDKKCWEIEFLLEAENSAKRTSFPKLKLGEIKQECSKDEYCHKVETIQDNILNGDVYEVNLTQQFTANFSGSTWKLFKALYSQNRAPFSAYLEYENFSICSISPEEFLHCEDRNILTRPIKGTAPRGKSLLEDKKQKEALLSSEKDLAELHMIVDLLRNDLSKVAEIGSVNVLNPNQLQTFSNVFHLVGVIEGRLKKEISMVELIKACFPGGSITGCPKIASMTVIEKMETYKRQLYTGSIFIMNNRFLESSIAIRTGIIQDNRLFVNSGGAITIDS
ncbi:MAG: hypothetical protein B6226_01930, partial [Candidatus Cloacimonetes bacterium 4572_65]